MEIDQTVLADVALTFLTTMKDRFNHEDFSQSYSYSSA